MIAILRKGIEFDPVGWPECRKDFEARGLRGPIAALMRCNKVACKSRRFGSPRQPLRPARRAAASPLLSIDSRGSPRHRKRDCRGWRQRPASADCNRPETGRLRGSSAWNRLNSAPGAPARCWQAGRAAAGLELTDVARDTRVPIRHLKALEADKHDESAGAALCHRLREILCPRHRARPRNPGQPVPQRNLQIGTCADADQPRTAR